MLRKQQCLFVLFVTHGQRTLARQLARNLARVEKQCVDLLWGRFSEVRDCPGTPLQCHTLLLEGRQPSNSENKCNQSVSKAIPTLFSTGNWEI